jgi:hypothetical protein
MVIAFLLNVYAIIAYDTPWTELYTQLLWVLCIGAAFYALSIVLRLIWYGLRALTKKKKL